MVVGVPLENFANQAQTTLNGGISAVVTSIIVTDASKFPTTGKYKLTVDSEVMTGYPPVGNTITVDRGVEGAAASHLNGATVSLYITAEDMLNIHRALYGFGNFLRDVPAQAGAFTVVSATAQNALLKAQIRGKNFKTYNGLDDQLLRNCINYEFPYNIAYSTAVPLIIPEFMRVSIDGGLKRDAASGGAITSNYDGDTASKALANLYQPTMIIPPNGHVERAQIYCNPDGVHTGSGIFAGKTWVPSGVTLINPGINYTPGTVIDLAQPSQAPYTGTRVTVNTVDGSGGILTYTMSRAGQYALPDKLQRLQWTQANGYVGVPAINGAVTYGVSGQVFDATALAAGTPAFLSQAQTGAGTGATFTQQWKPDWATGNKKYYGGNGVIGATCINDVYISAIGKSADPLNGDPTYGFKFGFWCWGLNFDVGRVVMNGGDIGIYASSSIDFRANSLNPVRAGRGMVMEYCSSYECPNVVIDTPDYQYFTMDSCNNVNLPSVVCFHNTAVPSIISSTSIRIGGSSASDASHYNYNCKVNFTMSGAGHATNPVAALYFDWSRSTKINLDVTNYQTANTPTSMLISSFVQFGSHIDPSCELTGSIDWGGLFPPTSGGTSPNPMPSTTYNPTGTPLPIYTGTMPNCRVSIRNADVVGTGVPGVLDESGNYTIKLSAPPISGNWPLNTICVNTNPAAGNPRGWYCSVAGTNNNGGTWTPL